MIKKAINFALICSLLIAAGFSPVSAQTKTDENIKIKAKVQKRATGKNKRVEVRMLNGTKIKGDITQAGEDSFTLTDLKTNQSSTIAYRDVAKVKFPFSKGDKIAFAIVGGATIAAVAVLGAIFGIRCRNEGGC